MFYNFSFDSQPRSLFLYLFDALPRCVGCLAGVVPASLLQIQEVDRVDFHEWNAPQSTLKPMHTRLVVPNTLFITLCFLFYDRVVMVSPELYALLIISDLLFEADTYWIMQMSKCIEMEIIAS